MSGIGSKSAPTYNIPAPSNYVAGVGRGAMGFTTRSDIGPARAPAPAFGAPGAPAVDYNAMQAPAGYVAGVGRGMGELARSQGEVPGASAAPTDGDRGDYSESNYDEFAGYGERLFAAGAYDEDDREADQIYDSVDDIMENRRKRSREKQLLLEQKRAKTERPRIADQFSDLKRELATVTADQWDAIPEIGDYGLRLKQSRKKDSFTPVPDSLLASSANMRGEDLARSIDPSSLDGTATSLSSNSSRSVVSGMRGTALTSSLDKVSDSVTGQTVVDPKGYITSLNSIKFSSSAEIGDIKRARALLQSVTSTNPKHGPGWIAAARVEEYANKMTAARKIILQGCEQAADSEDVWLEAARLHPVDTAKAILANGVKKIPSSVKIWLCAAELETNEGRKKAVLRRSLEIIPNSVQLWKAAIELENVTDARIMLSRAVECVPTSVEMWLALAKLETHENARKVLNKAREEIPTERMTWITAARLEEAHGNLHLVDKIIEKMVLSLQQNQVLIKRDEWIQDAVDAERTMAPKTAASIIRNTIALNVDFEDRKKTWMDDADHVLTLHPPAIETSRAILHFALEVFPSKKSIWQQLAMLEKEHGTPEQLEEVLKRGVQHCPNAEVLWLMAAKEKWLSGNVPDARMILLEAFNANSKSEQIWLAAVKLEWENDEFIRARLLLQRARERAPSERVYLKSALLERELFEYTAALQLLDEGIAKYPSFSKFYMMAGQICCEEDVSKSKTKDNVKAREYFVRGLKANPASIPLWRLLISLEERVKGVVKARPTAEMARLKLPANDLIWLESIRLERRAGNDKLSENLMAQALKECPASGALWSEVLLTCSKTQQKSKAIDAIKRCDQDALVVLTIARLFERSARFRKAQKWFNRAVTLNPRLGDAWIYYFAFEYVQNFRDELVQEGRVLRASEILQQSAVPGAQGEVAMDGVDQDDEDNNNDDNDAAVEGSDLGRPKSDPVPSNSSSSSAMMVADDDSSFKQIALKTLIQRCVESQPNQGELWCSIAKQTHMRRKDVSIILVAAAEQVLGFSFKYFSL